MWLQLEVVGGQVSVGSEPFEGFGIWVAVTASGLRQPENSVEHQRHVVIDARRHRLPRVSRY